MKRLWPLAILILPLAVAAPFLPLRRIAWRLTTGDDSPSPRGLVWFMSLQQSDGSWDEGPASLEGHALGRPGMTGFALLTFLGRGYSHLSKDEYEWYVSGGSVRKGLQWLLADQLPDGNFRSSPGTLDHVLATLALSEAYGTTGSNRFKDQAQAALDALAQRTVSGGLEDDAVLHAWAWTALRSAQICGLRVTREPVDRIGAFFDARESPAGAREVVVRLGMSRNKDHPRLPPAVARLAACPPRWEQQDFASWYWGSLATFHYDGPSGPNWKAWNDLLKNTLVQSQSSRGDWPGRNRGETLVRTCLATLTLEVYGRAYQNPVPPLPEYVK